MIQDSLNLVGEYHLLYSKSGLLYTIPNLITRDGKNHVLRMLLDLTGVDVGLTHVALGSGTTAPHTRDTELESEVVRRSMTQRPDTPGQSASFLTFFTAAEIPATLEEIGVFGHDATDAADSGLLFSRAVRAVSNPAGEDLLVTYVLRVV